MEDQPKTSPIASGSGTPIPADSAAATPTPAPEDAPSATPPAAWTTHYDSLVTKLPAAISSHIPPSAVAASTVGAVTTRLSAFSSTGTAHLSALGTTGSAQLGELQRSGSKRLGSMRNGGKKLGPDQFLRQAYSITNETQVALNVSLNQVGPLMYGVLLPNETFARRVPNVWYSIEIRPWTSPSTAYTPWSVTWPILSITGPVVAATSLLAIPFVALAMGGTALASLTGFGASLASGVAATSSAVTSTTATAASLAARAAYVPGGNKIKGRLVDAAKKNLVQGQGAVQERVVRYLSKGTAVAALGGVVGGERERRKVDEVEVTGFELEKVLKCETGKKKVDKALVEAFKKISFKDKSFKSSENPVLRITGGPELEERGKRSYLVFYPFILECIPDLQVAPLSSEEAPPTATEETFIQDAKVVETAEEAEKVAESAPVHGEGQPVHGEGQWAEEKREEVGKAKGKKGWFW